MRPDLLPGLLAIAAVGCVGDPVNLASRGDAGAEPTDAAHLADAFRPGDGGAAPGVDRAAFRDVIMPILDRRCSTGACHALTPMADARFELYASPDHPAATLTDDQLDANLGEVLTFANLGAPDDSAVLRYPSSQAGGDPSHPTAQPVFFPGSEEREALRAWLGGMAGAADAGVAADAGIVAGSDASVPCAALPDPAQIRGAAWFAAYRDPVDGMLRSACAAPACHGTAGAGGGYWLRTGPAECDLRWNFLVAQWFLDPVTPLASPLLVKPLDPAHGDGAVFQGTDDARFVMLRDWIVSGQP
jgi:hypothetical protein